jgi:hypothetical protein
MCDHVGAVVDPPLELLLLDDPLDGPVTPELPAPLEPPLLDG